MHIEKRKHLPGYYVSFTKNKTAPNKTSVKKAPVETQQINPEYSSCNTPIAAQTEMAISETKMSLQSPAKVTSSKITAGKPVSRESMQQVKQFSSEPAILQGNREAETGMSGGWMLAGSGLLIAMFAAAFRPFVNNTRKIGYWALNNRKLARGLHFVAHCGIAGSGYYLGQQLNNFGLHGSEVTTYGLAGFASLVTLMYPLRKARKGIFKNTYIKQKMFALVTALSGLFLFINIGNSQEAKVSQKENTNMHSKVIENENNYNTITFTNQEEDVNPKAKKIVLTVLVILLCIVLSVLLAAASCGLICTGQGAIAALLIIVGAPLVIILTVHLIKAIWKVKPKAHVVPEPVPVPVPPGG